MTQPWTGSAQREGAESTPTRESPESVALRQAIASLRFPAIFLAALSVLGTRNSPGTRYFFSMLATRYSQLKQLPMHSGGGFAGGGDCCDYQVCAAHVVASCVQVFA